MSRTPFAPLFDRLVDDAAVFPPGNAALDVTVREHLDRRTTGHGPHVGPLLVPAAAAGDLAALAAADDRTAAEPLAVSLVVRPGSPGEALADAVGTGAEQERALDDVAEAVDADHDVRAKFRTGPTPTWPWPDEAALGAFLDAVVLRGL